MSRLGDDDPSAVLLRQVKAPPPLSPAQVERIADRLRALPPVGARRGGLVLGMGLALTAALLAGVWLGRWGVRPTAPRTGDVLAAGETVRGHGPGGREWLVRGPGRFAYDGDGALAIDAGRLVARGGAGGLRVRLARGAVDVPPGATVEVEVYESWFRVAAYTGRVRVAPAGAAPVDLAARQGLRCEGETCGAPQAVTAGDDPDALLAAPTASATPASTTAVPASTSPTPAPATAAPATTPATATAVPVATASAPASASSSPARASSRTAFASTEAAPRPPSHRAGAAMATPDGLRTPGAARSARAYEPSAPSNDPSPALAPSSAAAASAATTSSPALPPELPPAALPSPPVSPGGALADESQRLEDALHALRQRHDPARALAATRAYRERFPGGVLAGEADRIDLEALLALGRSGDALALIERMPAGEHELRVWRAELRAAAGRCAAALPDFAAVLATAPSAAVAERALYGQAGCRTRLGDRAGADRDLAAYLARFPDGRHADDVRRALAHPR